ncbi:MAG: trigger factor [Calditrichales bacterium]|nr:trigger factor [Calditrichales bacterium]
MITTEIKMLSSCRKELSITMEKADLETIREKETKRVRKEAQYPGFRKGKAPLDLVKSKFADTIQAYTLEAAVDESLRYSLKENDLPVVGTPEAKKVDFNEDGSLITIIEVETYPEIELKKYKSFKLVKDEYTIKDKFIDDAIDRLRQQKAEVTTVDAPIEKGHIVSLDMQELDEEGNPVKGKKYSDISVHVGDGRFDPELEEQLTGLVKGEEKVISKIYPDDFPQKDFAGKKELYNIKIKNVQKEDLPELNDEFVKDLGIELETVEDLRKTTRQRLKHEYAIEAEKRFSADLSQKLLEENPFDIPNVLVDNYLDKIVADVRKQNPKVNEDDARQHYKADALFSIKLYYLKEQIVKKENIEVNEEDVDKFLDELNNDKIRDAYKNNISLLERVKEDILDRKTFDFLVNNSKITTNKIDLH